MNSTTSTHLRIWEQNLNCSLISQLHLLNSAHPNDWEVLTLQEPWIGHLGTRNSPHWRVLYPDTYFIDNSKKPCSLILINTNITTNCYEQVHFNSPDVTGVLITHGLSKTMIINIYNDCNHNESIDTVSTLLTSQFPNVIPDDTHIIFSGDFNCHHSWWESPQNTHITSSETTMKPLLNLIFNFDLRMALPPNVPTLCAHSTGNWTRLDNVWCTSHTSDLIVKCDTNPGLQGPNTDHLPILTTLNIPLTQNVPRPSRNFRATNWPDFVDHLASDLNSSPPKLLTSPTELQTALASLNASIKSSIEAIVPMSTPFPFTKRWWTPALTALCKKKNRLAKASHRWCGLPDHNAHNKHRTVTKEYAKLIESLKKEHWEEWLLNISERDLWTANKYVTDPPTDGSRTRMPTLSVTNPGGSTRHTNSNAKKSDTLEKSFFPPPPLIPSIPSTCYPQPANIFKYFSRAQIIRAAN